eukprot:Tamp_24269.p1 GENE.Tamp_24269~~Tamp_24269.p1  ORF type:complete len:106 (+),score=10.83 Tamp_24269:183-500(+)
MKRSMKAGIKQRPMPSARRSPVSPVSMQLPSHSLPPTLLRASCRPGRDFSPSSAPLCAWPPPLHAGLKQVDARMLSDHNAMKKEIDEELERQFPLNPSKKNAPPG